jgi:hypothetical protein
MHNSLLQFLGLIFLEILTGTMCCNIVTVLVVDNCVLGTMQIVLGPNFISASQHYYMNFIEVKDLEVISSNSVTGFALVFQ